MFLDYDQAALDDAYDQVAYAPNRDRVHERCVAASASTREALGAPRAVAYGPAPDEYVDFFSAGAKPAPVFVFVHGGAWRASSLPRFHFIAEPFVRAGAHCAFVQFSGVEEAGGNLTTLAEQVRKSIAWIYRNSAALGIDSSRIFVGGHSSGAHLTAVALTTEWTGYGIPAEPIAGALCCSGMYDLEGVSRSKRSLYVRFDPATIEALSPQRHLDRIRMPLIVAYGTYETPEFQRLGREFVAALERIGRPVTPVVVPGTNHFEILETLGNPYGAVGRAVLRAMGLAPRGS